MALAASLEVPSIDLRLQFVAFGQQRMVLWRQVLDDGAEASPELLGGDTRAGRGFVGDEVVKFLGYRQAMTQFSLGHLPSGCQQCHAY